MLHKEHIKLLDEGIKRLALKMTSKQMKILHLYIEELLKYREKINIIGTRDPQEIIVKHILDSLSGLSFFTGYKHKKIADIGSGAGLPGIICAIADPDNFYTCIESKKKKTDFIEYFINISPLKNARVINKNVYEILEKFDIITARAYSNTSKILKAARNISRKNTIYIFYKGKKTTIDNEIQDLSLNFTITQIHVPFLDDERHLLIHTT